MGDWEEDLCGCFKNFSSCIIVACIPGGYCYVQGMAVARAHNKSCSQPYMWPCLFGWFGAAYNRHSIRARYLIEGSYIWDCIYHAFFGPCSVCQEHREINRRELR